jgi:hypothetical protein
MFATRPGAIVATTHPEQDNSIVFRVVLGQLGYFQGCWFRALNNKCKLPSFANNWLYNFLQLLSAESFDGFGL